MGNCPPLPCPSPCPDLSFQDICANNNCHGCCIFHCSNPSVPAEAPPEPCCWDSPPLQPPPYLLPQQAGTATARDVVPAVGYRSCPPPWPVESAGLVATVATTERDSGGVPAGNGDRHVPSLPTHVWSGVGTETGSTGNDAGGVPRHGDRLAPPPSRRTNQSSSRPDGDGRGVALARNYDQPSQLPWRDETWTGSGRDAGAAAADMPVAAAPPTGNGGRRAAPSSSPRPVSVPPAAVTVATGRDDGRSVARSNSGQPAWRALSGLAETWALGRDAGVHDDVPADDDAAAVESGQDGSMRRDSWSRAPSSRMRDTQEGRLPSPSPSPSLSATGRHSTAESHRRFPRASWAQGTTYQHACS
ncbi:unnamed protein product [Urochloa humidicola]